jgi:diguanylate cyclase (GGDEF)-like protein
MLDLDHFKELNDSRGHDAGDFILREFGRVLLSQTRAGDIACRYGGEEFTVILPGATREASAQRARQLRDAIASARFQRRGQDLGSVTVSIGVAAFPHDGYNWESVLRQADQALFRAKRSGRDRVEAVQK